MNRRLFLTCATVALPMSGIAATSDGAIAFYDGRYAASRRFAAAQAHEGAAICDIQPDALAVWRAVAQTLSPTATHARGMTTYSDFIVLQDSARERGLALVQVAEHDGRRSGAPTLYSWHFTPHGRDQGSTTPTRAR